MLRKVESISKVFTCFADFIFFNDFLQNPFICRAKAKREYLNKLYYILKIIAMCYTDSQKGPDKRNRLFWITKVHILTEGIWLTIWKVWSNTYKHTTFRVVRHNTAFLMHCQTGDFPAETGGFLYGILILFVGIRLDLPKCWERKRTPDSGGVAADCRCQKARSYGDCGGRLRFFIFR